MTTEELRAKLQTLEPIELAVEDESEGHKGHGASGGHFSVRIVSARFSALSEVARHRLVYAAVGDAMKGAVHALRIVAKAPGESP